MTLTACVRVRKPKRLPEAQAAWANCISLLAVVVVRPFYGCSDPGMPLSSNGNSVEACSPPFPGPLSHGRLLLLYRAIWRCQEWDRLTACAPSSAGLGRASANIRIHLPGCGRAACRTAVPLGRGSLGRETPCSGRLASLSSPHCKPLSVPLNGGRPARDSSRAGASLMEPKDR